MGGAEIIKGILEAFNRRDAEAMIALQHPEAEFVPITAAMEGRVYRRPDEIREFIRSIELDWELFQTYPEEYFEVEDRALALGTWRARGRGSGLELDSHSGGWFVSVRDGLAHRWRTFTDRAEALEALGVDQARLADHRVHPS
jgi:ketosteroid isomerase-like protein